MLTAPITADDPILSAIRSSVPAGFLADVVNLINRAPSLLDQINQLDGMPLAGGGTARIALQTGAGNGANSFYHAPIINIGALSSYDDTQVIAVGGSLETGQTEALVTPAGVFVGLLAYELAHWTDAQLGPIYDGGLGGYTIEQAVATEFASEGKSADSQYVAMSQIQASEGANPVPSGMANGNILFNVNGDPTQDTKLLQQMVALQGTAAPFANTVSLLASQFWNVPVDGGTFVSTMWNGYGASGAVDDLGIAVSQITGFSVSETEAGSLAGCTIQTAMPGGDGRTYAIACAIPGQQQAVLTDSVTGATLAEIDTVIDPSTGMLGLTVKANDFTFDMPSGAQSLALALALTGNGDTLVGANAPGALHLTLSGAHALVVLQAGSTSITGAAATTTVFGGASDVTYGGGGILVMGSGAASVAGAAAQTVFGGAGGVTYQGATDYADVIGGTGACTIHAGSGGGWYGGGSLGDNLLIATGAGTVLDAGGNGDTLTGAAGGGAYLIAARGNETLQGGNQAGDTVFFLGSGADLVTAGAGGSIVVTSSGAATILGGGGNDQVWGGTGGADRFVAARGGVLDIHGFRTGIDHLSASGQSLTATAQGAAGTMFTLSSGATIMLAGVDAPSGSVFS